jgi:hypothetical protein
MGKVHTTESICYLYQIPLHPQSSVVTKLTNRANKKILLQFFSGISLRTQKPFSLHSISQFFFIMYTRCVLCEGRTDSLHIIQVNLLPCFQLPFARKTRGHYLETFKAEHFVFPHCNNNNKYSVSQYIFRP